MQQTIETVFGTVAVFLAGVVLVGALAVAVLAEGYYLVGFGIRLYSRCSEILHQIRSKPQHTPLDQDKHVRTVEDARHTRDDPRPHSERDGSSTNNPDVKR
jgi:Na+/H+ antiporter NhaB